MKNIDVSQVKLRKGNNFLILKMSTLTLVPSDRAPFPQVCFIFMDGPLLYLTLGYIFRYWKYRWGTYTLSITPFKLKFC